MESIRKKLNRNTLIFGVFIVIVLLFCLAYYLLSEKYKGAKIENSMPAKENNTVQGECQQGWNFYKNDVIGISFCYPKDWGDVKSDPTGPITKLDNLSLDEYETGSIYNDHFEINFSEINNQLTFFNGNFGSSDSSLYTRDSVSNLASTGDVCNFSANNPNLSNEEYYNECDNGIKTVLINTKDAGPGGSLQFFAYKKLQNGYFDNLLISHVLKWKTPIQFTQKYNRIDDVLPLVEMDKNNFTEGKAQFETFMNSIKIFSPIQPQKKDFENIAGEDTRITAIRKYYWLISRGRIDEAYAMEDGKEESYEDFASHYNNVYNIEASYFKNIGDNEFSFSVFREDNNDPVVKYEVNMSVTNGKLKTTLIEKIVSEEIKSDEYTVFSSIRGNKTNLIIKNEDKETVIDQEEITDVNNALYENKPIFHCPFSSIKFSPGNEYLIYTVYRPANSKDEGLQDVSVYDIKNKKIALQKPVGDGTLIFDFAPSEKSFYICANPDYSGKVAGEVYSVPQFQKVFDAFAGTNKTYQNITCEYKKDANSIVFTLTNPSEKELPATKEVQYQEGKSGI